MSATYVPPPPKPIRQLKPLPVAQELKIDVPLPSAVPMGPGVYLSSINEEAEEEDPYRFAGVPPRVVKSSSCRQCGCQEKLVGYGIQFNANARYDGAEAIISKCRRCGTLLNYQL